MQFDAFKEGSAQSSRTVLLKRNRHAICSTLSCTVGASPCTRATASEEVFYEVPVPVGRPRSRRTGSRHADARAVQGVSTRLGLGRVLRLSRLLLLAGLLWV